MLFSLKPTRIRKKNTKFYNEDEDTSFSLRPRAPKKRERKPVSVMLPLTGQGVSPPDKRFHRQFVFWECSSFCLYIYLSTTSVLLFRVSDWLFMTKRWPKPLECDFGTYWSYLKPTNGSVMNGSIPTLTCE